MFENMPYSNFHDLNTDWIVKKIKDVETSEANAKASEDNAKDSEIEAKASELSAMTSSQSAEQSADIARESASDAQGYAIEAGQTVANTLEQVSLLQARVDNIIPSGTQTEGNTELLDIRVGYNGVTYSSAGDAVREQDSAIASNLKYNSYNMLRMFGTFQNRTGAGVVYTWNADKTTCHAEGTTTGTSITGLTDGNTIPDGMEVGGTYIVKCETTDPNLMLEINAYGSSGSIEDLLITQDRLYTVPEGTVRILMRIRTRHTTASPSTVNADITVGIFNTLTNKQLDEKIDNVNKIANLPLRQYMQIFPKYTTIGDSLMGGFMNRDGVSVNTATAREAGNNWVNYIAIRIGRTFTNLAIGGSTAKQWRESLISTANIDTDCYLIGIGVNDHRESLPIGTPSDIATDFNNNSDSFYGNYDFMVRQLMTWKPNAHIFCFTIPEIEGGTSANYNVAIRAITALYPNKVHCIDLANTYAEYYDDPIVTDNYTGRHFNPVAYNYMSLIVEKAINDYIQSNDDLFATAPYA